MRYKALVGMNYPKSAEVDAALRALAGVSDEERRVAVTKILESGGMVRVEAGAFVDNLPELSIPWMLEQGYIEVVEPKIYKKPDPVAEPAAWPTDSASGFVLEGD